MDAPPFNGLAEHNGLNPVYHSVAHLYTFHFFAARTFSQTVPQTDFVVFHDIFNPRPIQSLRIYFGPNHLNPGWDAHKYEFPGANPEIFAIGTQPRDCPVLVCSCLILVPGLQDCSRLCQEEKVREDSLKHPNFHCPSPFRLRFLSQSYVPVRFSRHSMKGFRREGSLGVREGLSRLGFHSQLFIERRPLVVPLGSRKQVLQGLSGPRWI